LSAARKLAALDPAARRAALVALDEISRPMTKIEIKTALVPHLSRSLRRPVARALAALDVIAIGERAA
jgi:hypothetical protein